jgi:EmrB/QacA subfamily drug resistance transporter
MSSRWNWGHTASFDRLVNQALAPKSRMDYTAAKPFDRSGRFTLDDLLTSPNTRPRFDPVALLVAGAFFMENLDGTVIATALPQMAVSFSTDPAALGIGMTAYLLTLAIVIPASGWVADRFGARKVFLTALAVFTVASILCAICDNRWEFIAARVLQGIGGSLMTPVGRLVVLRGTPKDRLLGAIATLTWPGLVAPVLGPPIGGFITSVASWRWIFLLNVPLGIIALALTLRLIHDDAKVEARPFDLTGFLLNGIGLAVLLYALDLLGHPDSDIALSVLALAASAIIGWFAFRHALRSPHPLVSLGAFGIPSFRIAMTGGSVSRIAISALPFLLPLTFQVGLDMDPFASGLLILWFGLANIGVKPATSWILRRFGFRNVLIVNTFLTVASIAACTIIGPHTPVVVIGLIMMVGGATRSMQFTSLNTLSFADTPPAFTASANIIFNVAFQLAVGLGIAFGAIILRVLNASLGAPQGPISIHIFQAAYICTAVLALLPLINILRLSPEAGSSVSGHKAA